MAGAAQSAVCGHLVEALESFCAVVARTYPERGQDGIE